MKTWRGEKVCAEGANGDGVVDCDMYKLKDIDDEDAKEEVNIYARGNGEWWLNGWGLGESW